MILASKKIIIVLNVIGKINIILCMKIIQDVIMMKLLKKDIIWIKKVLMILLLIGKNVMKDVRLVMLKEVFLK